MQDDIDLKIWQQERDFWIPRVSLILTSNSLLFLGYVMILQNILGIIISILALISNIAMALYLHNYEERINSLEKRIRYKLPLEYRDTKYFQECSTQGLRNQLCRCIGYGIKGRGGYRMVILVFLILWISALFFSGWVNYQTYINSKVIENNNIFDYTKELNINIIIPYQDNNHFLHPNETVNLTINDRKRYQFYLYFPTFSFIYNIY